MRCRLLPLGILIALTLPAAAVALPRQNPADALTDVPIEPSAIRGAASCAHVNKTLAHRDHVHIGMTKAGAAARTSFWRRHTG